MSFDIILHKEACEGNEIRVMQSIDPLDGDVVQQAIDLFNDFSPTGDAAFLSLKQVCMPLVDIPVSDMGVSLLQNGIEIVDKRVKNPRIKYYIRKTPEQEFRIISIRTTEEMDLYVSDVTDTLAILAMM